MMSVLQSDQPVRVDTHLGLSFVLIEKILMG